MYTTRTPTKWWDWGKRTVWRHSECQVRSIRKPKAHMEFGLWMLTSSVQLCMDKRRKWLISTWFEVRHMYFGQLWEHTSHHLYIYTLHATISIHCKVMSILSLFGDALSPMHVLQCAYIIYIRYVCMAHEYIVWVYICAGAQNMTKVMYVHTKEQLTVAARRPETIETYISLAGASESKP